MNMRTFTSNAAAAADPDDSNSGSVTHQWALPTGLVFTSGTDTDASAWGIVVYGGDFGTDVSYTTDGITYITYHRYGWLRRLYISVRGWWDATVWTVRGK